MGVSRLQQDAEGLILPRQDIDGDKGEEERADEHDEEGQADVVQHQQLKVQLRGRGGARGQLPPLLEIRHSLRMERVIQLQGLWHHAGAGHLRRRERAWKV